MAQNKRFTFEKRYGKLLLARRKGAENFKRLLGPVANGRLLPTLPNTQ